MLTFITALVAGSPDRVRLNTGQMMPLINCGGTAPSIKAGDHYSNYSEWLRQGGRGLDTALTYTDPLNAQIKAALAAHRDIHDTWITTKVPCCPGVSWCAQSEFNGSVIHSMQKNNELLGVKTTDITLLHHPCTTAEQTIEKYVELQRGMEMGLTKAIGVSNFNASLLAMLAADPRVKVVPAVNQCNHAIANHNESHNPKYGGDDATVRYCKAHGISYSAYSPLEGLSGGSVMKIPQVVAIAKAHGVSPAQVALRWLVQQNISAVTAAHNPQFISEDLDIFSFELTPTEMNALAAI
jgi:2,5-diketo-D-gluconate reductase A